MTIIAVIGESTQVTTAQARLITRACHAQIERHVAPLWHLEPWPVRYYRRKHEAPKDALQIRIMRNGDNVRAHGFHDETRGGRPFGRVFTEAILSDGGSHYGTPHSISACPSHEVIEAFIDPDLNLWAEGKSGEMYAYEACDPVGENTHADLVHVPLRRI